jgi:hypothetical protein
MVRCIPCFSKKSQAFTSVGQFFKKKKKKPREGSRALPFSIVKTCPNFQRA